MIQAVREKVPLVWREVNVRVAHRPRERNGSECCTEAI